MPSTRNFASRSASNGDPLGRIVKKWLPVNGSVVRQTYETLSGVLGCDHIVEVGCSYGLHLVGADDDFLAKYSSLDIGYAIEFAKLRVPTGHFVKGRLLGWELEDFVARIGKTSLIIVNYKMELMPAPDDVMKSILKLAAAGHQCFVFVDVKNSAASSLELSEYEQTVWSAEGFVEWVGELEGNAKLLCSLDRDSRSPSGSGACFMIERQGADPEPVGLDPVLKALAGLSRINDVDETPAENADVPEIRIDEILADTSIPAYIGGRFVETPLNFDVDTVRIEGDEKVIGMIEAAKESRAPYSIVRLGNGEGRLVGYPDYTAPIWLHRSYRNWFGERYAESSNSLIKAEMLASVVAADLVGIPVGGGVDAHWRFAQSMLHLYGTLPVSGAFCSHGFHISALKSRAFERLIFNEKAITVISPHDLREAIQSKFQVGDVRWFPIPGQAKFFRDDTRKHFPDVYFNLRNEINIRFKGEIFLIGAGPLGKIYCHWVKSLGGIALDIGSTLDVWAGFATRSGFGKIIPDFSLNNNSENGQ